MNMDVFKHLKSIYNDIQMDYYEDETKYLLKKLLLIPIIMFISLLILIFYEFVKWLTL